MDLVRLLLLLLSSSALFSDACLSKLTPLPIGTRFHAARLQLAICFHPACKDVTSTIAQPWYSGGELAVRFGVGDDDCVTYGPEGRFEFIDDQGMNWIASWPSQAALVIVGSHIKFEMVTISPHTLQNMWLGILIVRI